MSRRRRTRCRRRGSRLAPGTSGRPTRDRHDREHHPGGTCALAGKAGGDEEQGIPDQPEYRQRDPRHVGIARVLNGHTAARTDAHRWDVFQVDSGQIRSDRQTVKLNARESQVSRSVRSTRRPGELGPEQTREAPSKLSAIVPAGAIRVGRPGPARDRAVRFAGATHHSHHRRAGRARHPSCAAGAVRRSTDADRRRSAGAALAACPTPSQTGPTAAALETPRAPAMRPRERADRFGSGHHRCRA